MGTASSQRRIVCFSAYTNNLRATAFTHFLRDLGYEIIKPKPHGPSGSILELVLTLLPNCWLALTCRADLAAGFKPHPNVTLPLLICKLRGMPTWIDVDDLDHAYREGLVSRLVEWMQRPFPRLCTVISYHNQLLKDYLVQRMRCAPERLLRIPQGVHYAFFNEAVAPADLPVDDSKPVAIYAAHLNVASDLDPVLRAWRTVVEKKPGALLVVIGGGPMQGHFQRLAVELGLAAQVCFTGEVRHAEVRRYFARADVALLYMSRRLVNKYRCSLKLREYFAAGLKVVCNDFGELDEFAELTYQTKSGVGDFAAMIVRVLEGFDDGRQETARRFAREQLDWPRIIETAAADLARHVKLAPPRQLS
jgi:glycosyltransferase involved in cell wall biosynthesis